MTDLSSRYNQVDPDMIEKRKKRIRSIRYKVYMFICVVFIIFFWPTFLSAVDKVRGKEAFKLGNIFSEGFVEAIFTYRGDDGLLNQIDTLEEEITEIEGEIQVARVEHEILKELNNLPKQYKIARCVNKGECEELDQRLLDNINLLRSYIILSELEGEKMAFNQKLILESINEFLLDSQIDYVDTETGAVVKSTFAGASLIDLGSSGGFTQAQRDTDPSEWIKLQEVSFGEPELKDKENKLYRLPINLQLEFPHRQSLLTFLTRIEDHISFKYPILYEIESMDYNIVDYGFEQLVRVNMYAYYYKSEFEEQKEEKDDNDDT